MIGEANGGRATELKQWHGAMKGIGSTWFWGTRPGGRVRERAHGKPNRQRHRVEAYEATTATRAKSFGYRQWEAATTESADKGGPQGDGPPFPANDCRVSCENGAITGKRILSII
ncbi:hypothetical protein GW17_00038328 [Ensete ventricosum]|nr:hypothetical protein GW17_00038328 [Ensete ventricosum]